MPAAGAAARAEVPPPDFYGQSLYLPSPDGGYDAPVATGKSVAGFTAGLPPGVWEPGGDGAWTYRAARPGGELVALFQQARSGAGVLLARASIGGREIAAGRLRAALAAPASPPARPSPQAPRGPDLAAMAQGRDTDSMLDVVAIQNRFRDLMGDDAFAVAQVFAAQGAQPVMEAGGLAQANACPRQACKVNQVRFVMDHSAGAWASLTQNGATAYFGDPPARIRRLLAP